MAAQFLQDPCCKDKATKTPQQSMMKISL